LGYQCTPQAAFTFNVLANTTRSSACSKSDRLHPDVPVDIVEHSKVTRAAM